MTSAAIRSALELDSGRPSHQAGSVSFRRGGASPLPQLPPPAVAAAGGLLIGNVSPHITVLFSAPPCADDDIEEQNFFLNETRGTTIG